MQNAAMPPIRSTAALIALTLGLGACGDSGGSGSTLARTDLIAKANQICTTAQSKSAAIQAPKSLADPVQAAKYFDQVAPITAEETADLKALEPDGDAKSDWNAFVSAQAAANSLLQQITHKADAHDPTGLQDLRKAPAAGQKVAAAATKLGASNCASLVARGLQLVVAPEVPVADADRRDARDAQCKGSIGVVLQLLLDGRVFDAGTDDVLVEPGVARGREQYVQVVERLPVHPGAGEDGFRVGLLQSGAVGGDGGAQRLDRPAVARPAFGPGDRRQPVPRRAPLALGAPRGALAVGVERPRDALLRSEQEAEGDRLPKDVLADDLVDARRSEIGEGRVVVVAEGRGAHHAKNYRSAIAGLGHAGDMTQITLNDDRRMPQLGFGTWQIPQDDTARLVEFALGAGYRAIDTASAYQNERGVGAGLGASGLARDEVFVTTKLWNSQHGRDAATAALDKSLGRLGLDAVDLYLIHWPLPAQGLAPETWQALVDARANGKARSIGVSNFRIEDLEEIIEATGVVPAANQIELHPRMQQRELRAFHAEHGIATIAWSPLGQGRLLRDEAIVRIADKTGRTPAQVIIRWHVQLGNVVIPKSVTPSRIEENLDVDFALDQDAMAEIEELDEGSRIGPDPATFALGAS